MNGHGLAEQLPDRVFELVFGHLPVQARGRFAAVCHRFRDIADRDGAWIAGLALMGVWNAAEARDSRHSRRLARQQTFKLRSSQSQRSSVESVQTEEQEVSRSMLQLEPVDLAHFNEERDKARILAVFSGIHSAFGRQAKLQFARVWCTLWPPYRSLTDPIAGQPPLVMSRFVDLEEQARLFSVLARFSRLGGDYIADWAGRQQMLQHVRADFESKCMQELRVLFSRADDSVARMRKYTDVLVLLNGGSDAYESYKIYHLSACMEAASPRDCLAQNDTEIEYTPLRILCARIRTAVESQVRVAGEVFPPEFHPLRDLVLVLLREGLAKYVCMILECIPNEETGLYMTAVAGTFEICLGLVNQLSDNDSISKVLDKQSMVAALQTGYEHELGTFLQEETETLREKCAAQVRAFDEKIKTDAQTAETLLRSNVNREATKKNFLASFQKMVLMPVTAIPRAFQQQTPSTSTRDDEERPSSQASNHADLPTTDMAAQAAIMEHRLEGIRTLFSMDVALQLIHFCRSCLSEARPFSAFDDPTGELVREKCQDMFVILLEYLGDRHIKRGFDQAIDHMMEYNPRSQEAAQVSGQGVNLKEVQPLVVFLELVHVGDLIQQMVDLFFTREMDGLLDRSDFFNPAVKEKKRFEQMIDERVATGLHRGIDVLMTQVEYILVTQQLPEDYRPPLLLGNDINLGPTRAAQMVLECLQDHLGLLVGSADKNILDVFYQEVGIRLFSVLCKHIKRQRISQEGGITFISDMNLYHHYIESLRQREVMPYFVALKEIGNIFIIDGRDAKSVGQVVSDIARFAGVLRPEDVYEFVQCRTDWLRVKREVDRNIYGFRTEDCMIM